jgi:hypothetical protein
MALLTALATGCTSWKPDNELVSYLIENGWHNTISIFCENHIAYEPSPGSLDVAAGRGYLKVLRVVFATNQEAFPSQLGIKCAVVAGHFEIIKWIVGLKPHYLDYKKLALVASRWGHLDFLKWLVEEKGALL